MNRESVRLIVGMSVIVTHIVAFLGIVVWQKDYITSPAERLDVAMLLVPVSAGYFVAVVRSAIQRQDVIDERKPVNLNYIVVSLLVTFAFCGTLIYFVFNYPDVVGPTTVELRRWLVALEIGFGGGFGLIAEDLFGKVEKVLVPQINEPKGNQ
jgi:hypothetical protein